MNGFTKLLNFYVKFILSSQMPYYYYGCLMWNKRNKAKETSCYKEVKHDN